MALMRACLREIFVSLTRTSASSARPTITSSRSSGIGTASKSPVKNMSAGRKSSCERFDLFIKEHGADFVSAGRSLTHTIDYFKPSFQTFFDEPLNSLFDALILQPAFHRLIFTV